MKDVSRIWDTFDSGLYIGDNRPHGRVTVEPDWFLNMTSGVFQGSKKGPYRWYQREDNSQVEVEIPNVKMISIDRSIDTDISTCTISIYNQWMDVNGAAPELSTQLGKPGYFSWGRGKSEDAQGRWGQSTNDWEDIIIPNALIRTYQGYGGFNEDGSQMDIVDAVDDEWITLSGVWLVDEVTLGTNGMLEVKCRDIGKLLKEQQMFPPLIPSKIYPIEFCRWDYKEFKAEFAPRGATTTGAVGVEMSPGYYDSSADRWYGPNADIHGHRGSDSVDGSLDSYALSVGNSTPSASFCTDWFEYTVNAQINEIYMYPVWGNYTMYVSVLEGGQWQSNGDGVIPYDYTPLVGTQPVAINTGADIPFVMQTGTTWESGSWYTLPRTYNAQRIRITFRNHAPSEWGPWYYRCGIRELKIRANTLATSPPADPWVFSIAPYRTPAVTFEAGYFCVVDDGQVFAFGDARKKDFNGPYPLEDVPNHPIRAIIPTHDGGGYYLLQANGSVYTYGNAVHHGDGRAYGVSSPDFCDMALDIPGTGYWILHKDGTVLNRGTATDYGDMTTTASLTSYETPRGGLSSAIGAGIESHPSLDGYWVVNNAGEVRAFGSVSSYGQVTPFRQGLLTDEQVTAIRRNSDGSGYWLLSAVGKVYAYGSAQHFGDIDTFAVADGPGGLRGTYEGYRVLCWDMAPNASDTGYYLQHGDGKISLFGDAEYFGEPGAAGEVRVDGNYKDYADIVKYLLGWSGWLLFNEDSTDTNDLPPIYGNIENTGAFAPDCLDTGLFDKKPPIDGINALKEIVGYIFYIDDEGAARFESPNWWSIGNFWNDGTPTDFLPEIDERTVLTDYTIRFGDDSARSEIIISTEDPAQANSTTITTRYVPKTSSLLRGMVKPAMWINGVFKNEDEQRIMAELIGMHIWFQQRQGQVSCLANPCIQINDQVRIFERNSSETYVHYVRGMNTEMDLDSGSYTMTLQTHWLGDAGEWVITKDDIPVDGEFNHVQISQPLIDWLKNQNNQKTTVARLMDFESDPISTITHEPGVTSGDGSAAAHLAILLPGGNRIMLPDGTILRLP